ncbi:MAG: PorT family protein [Bacteroidales bacterium]|nr:PorT family protein [Bacteroidales bacterium]
MKKLIVIVASLLVAVSAHAQLGVMAGITSSKADLKEAYADVKNATSYHVGVAYKMDLGLIKIQPAIIYNVKGSKVGNIINKATEGAVTAGDFEYKTGSIEVPVQLQAGLDLGIIRAYGILEPFVGYQITNTAQTTGGTKIDVKWSEVKNKLEYGVGLGAGVELIEHVQVAVRYFWNLGNASNANIATAYDAVRTQKASGIMASVVLLF